MKEKIELRRVMYERMQNLGREYIAQSDAAIFDTVTSMPEFDRAATVFAYASTGYECDTYRIVSYAILTGKPVALPIVTGKETMKFMLYTGTLVEGVLGIPTPPADGFEVFPGPDDIIIVPGLCYDEDGYRLGRGGGYYDRFLARSPAFTVGLCREKLIVPSLPRQAHDIPVDCVITEKERRDPKRPRVE